MNMNVLAVGCHPDDLEIACGGTLAKFAKNGANVFMCHVANGSLGHAEILPEDLKKIRRKEAISAGKILGAKEVLTLDIDDLGIDVTNEEIIDKLIEVIRYTKPDMIITHNDSDYMKDHNNTSSLVFDASFSSSLVHRATQSPAYSHIVPIYYMDTLAGINFMPEHYVDITDFIEIKLEALAAHESQIVWMKEHDHIDFLDFVRTCSKFRGLQSSVDYAECFRLCKAWPRVTTKNMLP